MGSRSDLLTSPTIHALLRELASAAPERVALLGVKSRPATFSDLLEQAETSAGWFSALSVSRQDRIATVVTDSPEMGSLFLGVASVATCAPLNPRFRASDFELYLSDLNPKFVVVEEGWEAPIRDVCRAAQIDILDLESCEDGFAGHFRLGDLSEVRTPRFSSSQEVALVLHTSGTT